MTTAVTGRTGTAVLENLTEPQPVAAPGYRFFSATVGRVQRLSAGSGWRAVVNWGAVDGRRPCQQVRTVWG